MPFFIVLTLIAYQILMIMVNLAVYAMLAATFGIGSVALQWVFVFLAVSFTIASILTSKIRNMLVGWFYTMSAYWFGLVNFLLGASALTLFAEYVFYSHGYYIAPTIIGTIFFAAIFFLHLYGTFASGRAGITKISVALQDLPAAWRGKSIVFVSDLHLGNIRGSGFAGKVARKILALAPEAIFIGGDMYDGGKIDPEELAGPLRSLTAPRGVYFISGNHDYYVSDPKAGFAAIRGLGIRILDNEVIDVDGLQVIGLDYKATHKKEGLETTLKAIAIDPKRPSILMKHEPDHLEIIGRVGPSLMLSGHTHHGQIYPFNHLTRRMYNGFDYGLKRLNAVTQVYTSSGVGTWGPPLRLGTKSEIVLIELQ